MAHLRGAYRLIRNDAYDMDSGESAGIKKEAFRG